MAETGKSKFWPRVHSELDTVTCLGSDGHSSEAEKLQLLNSG